MGSTNIQSSQSREVPVDANVVDNLQPLNGGSRKINRDPAGRNTAHVEKSTSSEQAGPKTNNL